MREPFWYLATVYRQYPAGLQAAFAVAAEATAFLTKQRVRVYSPIVHGHSLTLYGGLDPTDHEMWMDVDYPFMDAAVGLIVLKMLRWTESEGIAEEIKRFRADKKPVLYMEWED